MVGHGGRPFCICLCQVLFTGQDFDSWHGHFSVFIWEVFGYTMKALQINIFTLYIQVYMYIVNSFLVFKF